VMRAHSWGRPPECACAVPTPTSARPVWARSRRCPCSQRAVAWAASEARDPFEERFAASARGEVVSARANVRGFSQDLGSAAEPPLCRCLGGVAFSSEPRVKLAWAI